MSAEMPPRSPGDRLSELRESAQGWHKVQLAVLGFIGLCGVLLDGWTTQPRWLQMVAGALVLASLMLACLSTYLVGRVAWPVDGRRQESGSDLEEAERARRRLLIGLGLTFAAVACVALATATAWWPQPRQAEEAALSREPEEAGLVDVRSAAGSWCGRLHEGEAGTLSVVADGRRRAIPLDAVLTMRPVDHCEGRADGAD